MKRREVRKTTKKNGREEGKKGDLTTEQDWYCCDTCEGEKSGKGEDFGFMT